MDECSYINKRSTIIKQTRLHEEGLASSSLKDEVDEVRSELPFFGLYRVISEQYSLPQFLTEFETAIAKHPTLLFANQNLDSLDRVSRLAPIIELANSLVELSMTVSRKEAASISIRELIARQPNRDLLTLQLKASLAARQALIEVGLQVWLGCHAKGTLTPLNEDSMALHFLPNKKASSEEGQEMAALLEQLVKDHNTLCDKLVVEDTRLYSPQFLRARDTLGLSRQELEALVQRFQYHLPQYGNGVLYYNLQRIEQELARRLRSAKLFNL